MDRPGSVAQIFQSSALTRTQCRACIRDTIEEFGVVLEAILEPSILILEPNQHARWSPMTGDHDLAIRRQAEVAR